MLYKFTVQFYEKDRVHVAKGILGATSYSQACEKAANYCSTDGSNENVIFVGVEVLEDILDYEDLEDILKGDTNCD